MKEKPIPSTIKFSLEIQEKITEASKKTGLPKQEIIRLCTAIGIEDLRKEVFGSGWPQDALRHSYGSFRNAILRNLPQVAEEMGTSEAMLRRHYHNPKTTEEGLEWFALRPNVPICSDFEEIAGEDIGGYAARNA